jgi:RNA polymerase sigma-70 factor, ECF subfamily
VRAVKLVSAVATLRRRRPDVFSAKLAAPSDEFISQDPFGTGLFQLGIAASASNQPAMNQNHGRGVWQGVTGGRALSLARETQMQELVLIRPLPIAGGELAREANSAAIRREFEERLAECGPLAYRVARGVLRNAADAEDVAQEALLRAYRNFGRLREPQRFRGWLVRISFRLALDRTRSAKRREQRETLWAQPVRHSPTRTAEDLAASSEFQAHLDGALDELPEKLRLVLLLSAMEGHTMEEVSALLGIAVGTVKSRLFTARKKLAEKLQCYVSDTKKR